MRAIFLCLDEPAATFVSLYLSFRPKDLSRIICDHLMKLKVDRATMNDPGKFLGMAMHGDFQFCGLSLARTSCSRGVTDRLPIT